MHRPCSPEVISVSVLMEIVVPNIIQACEQFRFGPPSITIRWQHSEGEYLTQILLKRFKVPSERDCVFNSSFSHTHNLNTTDILLFESSIVLCAFQIHLLPEPVTMVPFLASSVSSLDETFNLTQSFFLHLSLFFLFFQLGPLKMVFCCLTLDTLTV